MTNARIQYLVKILQGEHKNEEVPVSLSLDEIEDGYGDISDKLIEKQIYTGMGHPCDYYKVLNRKIQIYDDGA